jgi:hypothetical protein
MAFEPRVLDPFAIIVRALRRVMPRITPPLDLSVIPFRYRVRAGRIEAIRPKCGHGHKRPSTRHRREQRTME